MPEWANKPDAVMHAEVMTTEAELDELYQFLLDNPMPRWLLCAGTPPHPTRGQLTFYLERGNNIIVARDQDNELWGYFIQSRKDGYALWLHVRREIDELHEEDGMTPNSRSSSAHMNALAWKLWGQGPRLIRVLAEGENSPVDNPNYQAIDHQALQARIESVYHEFYEGV